MTVTFFSALAITTAAQNTEKPAPRIIEVTGSAETLVTPNEFTFKITLSERLEKKEKVTIDQQEKRLKEELAKAGIDVQKDLTVFDLSSSYVSKKRRADVLASKDYRLKLTDIAKIEKLQEIADDLNITRLDLIDSTHSELTRLRKETKMEAVKAAKAKAEYMLGAIGERVGKIVFVQEVPDESYLTNSLNANSRSNYNYSANISRGVIDGADSSQPALTFTKIQLRYAVIAKFEIQ